MRLKRPLTDCLLSWYATEARELPWRKNRDPYQIWISEIMLQQTTVTAVKPYFEKFLNLFPNVNALAAAPLADVLQAWSGLGYYSRARNLHSSAMLFAKSGFPKSYIDLLKLPGLGPYTSRAVSSFAFSEPVGVLDGNVIRFLSRYNALSLEWWRPKEREKLQKLADEWVYGFDSHFVNQALIEIGSTVCTAKNPKCTSCPLLKSCKSAGSDLIEKLPPSKPKKAIENWLWKVVILEKNNQVALIKNFGLPVLKDQWIWPGTAKRVNKAPKQFSFQHAITHHKIFVKVIYLKSNASTKQLGQIKWFKKSQLKKVNPASIIHKALQTN